MAAFSHHFRSVIRKALVVKSALLLVLICPGLAFSPAAAAAPVQGDGLLSFLALDHGQHAQAIECLGDAIYYEAGFEPLDGQKAVAQVVLNRVRNPHFPGSVCGVVFQGSERRTGCQFSFTCDGSLSRRPPSPSQMACARAVASQVLDGQNIPAVGAATHYHTDYVHPYWSASLKAVAVVGRHIFYR